MTVIFFLLFSWMFPLNLQNNLPEYVLHSRNTNETTLLLIFIFVGAVFVAVSRLTNPNLFELVSNNFFRFKSIDKSFKEELRLGILSRFLMSINFIFSFSLCCYLLIDHKDQVLNGVTVSMYISIIYFIVVIWGHNVLRLFFDSNHLIDNFYFIGRSHVNFVGLFFLIFALIWVLKPELNNTL